VVLNGIIHQHKNPLPQAAPMNFLDVSTDYAFKKVFGSIEALKEQMGAIDL